jgi:hypothetical protein
MRTAAATAGLPPPEQAPALAMPAHNRFGRDERQVLTPVGTPPASQNPEQLVPGAELSARSGSSRPGQDDNLVAQQQVLEDKVLARADRGKERREQEPGEFDHVLSIVDLRRCKVLPPHTCETIGQWVRTFGPVFAQELRRRGRRPGDKLHLDEVALRSTVGGTGCGGRWTSTVSSSTSWCRAGEISTRPELSYGGRSEGGTTRRGWSSPTSTPVTHQPFGACCRTRSTGVTRG